MKTTKKQFEEFKRYFNHYVKLFGLQRYKIYFEHIKMKDAYAEILRDEENCVAIVKFNKNKEKELNIKSTALHEALHLLHNSLVYLARSRSVSSVEIQVAEEQIVNVLEKVIGD